MRALYHGCDTAGLSAHRNRASSYSCRTNSAKPVFRSRHCDRVPTPSLLSTPAHALSWQLSHGTLRRRKRRLALQLGAQVVSDSCCIRKFRETDAEAVVQLQATAFYESWGNDWADKVFFSVFKADVRSIVQQKLKSEDDSFQCILAIDHTVSKPVAVVEVSLQSNQEVLRALAAGSGETYAYVACMAVQEDFRRQGLALKLLKAAEKQAREWKQEVVALHVYKANDIALKAYEKAGYELLQVDGAWRAMLGAKQRILMYKSL